MKLRRAVPVAILLLAFAVPTFSAEYVYFAESPGSCTMEPVSYPGQVFSVYVLTGGSGDVSGVSFRLDTDRFGPEHVQSVTPVGEVSIVEGNIFDGITLEFPPGELDHKPVLQVVLSGHSAVGYVWTRDVILYRGQLDKSAEDQITVAYGFDCTGSLAQWDVPGTVEVLIDTEETVTFRAGLQTASYPGQAEVHVVDASGWVTTSDAQGVYAACEWCPWSWTTVTVPVHVPAGVGNGTLNEITLQMYSFGGLIDQTTVTLRAVQTFTSEETTWGKIKSLYR